MPVEPTGLGLVPDVSRIRHRHLLPLMTYPRTLRIVSRAMEFQEVVRRRRMVRNFADRPVEPAIVDRLLANAIRAPSAGFSPGWAFLVLDA
ncbi:MAG TPA: nitroreductase family protein, partial [Jiangellaceae bacterium]|nr:nitroreductase family protein [Jiangellaceae bacterium]